MSTSSPRLGLRIGLTGGMASGASTVAEVWKSLGARVLSSDNAVHRLLESDDDVKREIAEAFGSDVFDERGRIARSALGAIAFSDERARQRLTSILHPRTIAIHAAEADVYLREHPTGVVVFDSPLLFEAGLDARVDVTVVVASAREDQVARAVARSAARGAPLNREEVERRIAVQLPMDEKRRRATHVIENDGALADLQRKARELWTTLAGCADAPGATQ